MELNEMNLLNAYERGFIDQDAEKVAHHPPQMIINSKEENVLSSILDEMEGCDAFFISVAFITEGGLATLKTTLHELAKRNVRGKIITSTYLNFNKPKVFKALLNIPNIDVRIADKQGFHAKGYVFSNAAYSSLFIGSSNLTDSALKKNYEYNLKLTSLDNGAVLNHFRDQFDSLWDEATPVDATWIMEYERIYKEQPDKQKVLEIIEDRSKYQYRTSGAEGIAPNFMQQEALHSLKQLRVKGHDKGLVVSATGTGKTYLSAFDVKQFQPKRMLFLAHREQILEKARQDFMTLLEDSPASFGVFSGNQKSIHSKYLFATVQTMSSEDTLSQFSPDEFDYIIVDEAHRSSARTYRRIINYFKPSFLLGMTATPERTDDNEIFGLFDYNIAYEIRLQKALEEEILAPFHYFGVTDYETEDLKIDDTSRLSDLTDTERIRHLHEKIQYYGYSGETLCGLMFVSNKKEAEEISHALNLLGYRTIALTGSDSQGTRRDAVRSLENGHLDYIVTVDIFNEGIDIPSVNQVVMLRRTQSSIIFIQQLGRGLRKHDDKEYLTVIDFIGNYRNNYMIPIALTGDNSYSKDNLRRSLIDRTPLKGVSTINFEAVAKEKIYQAINASSLDNLRHLKEMYVYLKNKIGRKPTLVDFYYDKDVIDPMIILNKYRHYPEFLQKIKEKDSTLEVRMDKMLTFLSKELAGGKRIVEMHLLKALMDGPVDKNEFQMEMHKQGYYMSDAVMDSVIRVFTLEFFKAQDILKYGSPLVRLDSGYIYPSETLESALHSKVFMKHCRQIMELSLLNGNQYDQSRPLTLNQKYSRKDVCRMLNWQKDEASTIYGYKQKHGTCPVFITYHKNDAVDDTIKYDDEFLDRHTLKWFTRSNRTLASKEINSILDSHQNGMPIYIFVKKDDDEGTSFYYLGKSRIDYHTLQETVMPGTSGKPVVTMHMIMESPVEYNIYRYLDANVVN